MSTRPPTQVLRQHTHTREQMENVTQADVGSEINSRKKHFGESVRNLMDTETYKKHLAEDEGALGCLKVFQLHLPCLFKLTDTI